MTSNAVARGSPLLLIHLGAHHADAVPECLLRLRAQSRGQLTVGVTASMAHRDPARTAEYFTLCAAATTRIVDPQIHLHPQYGLTQALTARQSTFLPETIPDEPSKDWIRDLLARQRASGATHLLAPTGFLDGRSRPGPQTERLVRYVEAAREAEPTGAMSVSIAAHHQWLGDAALRGELLRTITESNEKSWYVRVQWPGARQRLGQLTEIPILEGYKELAHQCLLEDKTLVLPTTDLTGWICMAWGASGFGTGLLAGERAWRDNPPVRGRKGQRRPPDKQIFFEPSLLHDVEISAHRSIRETAGYSRCGCHYCTAMGMGTSSREGFTKPLSSCHHALHVGRLAALAGGTGRRQAVRTEVARAQRAFQQLEADGVTLSGSDRPSHLAVWGQVL